MSFTVYIDYELKKKKQNEDPSRCIVICFTVVNK